MFADVKWPESMPRAFCYTRFSRRALRARSKKGGCWPGRCAATLLGERPEGATLSGMTGKTGTLESPGAGPGLFDERLKTFGLIYSRATPCGPCGKNGYINWQGSTLRF